MKNMNPMNRREFLLRTGQAGLGAATLLGAGGLPLFADEKKITYP